MWSGDSSTPPSNHGASLTVTTRGPYSPLPPPLTAPTTTGTGEVSQSDKQGSRDISELKARLGLKKAGAGAAPATGATPSAPTAESYRHPA